MTVEEIAQNWLDECCNTILSYDHAAHMDLISKHVLVYGVPGFDVISYDDWFSQCEYEFSEKLIAQASYEGLKIRQSNDIQIMFLTQETVRSTDGTVDTHSVEIVLSREANDKWRAIQERLLSSDEARHLRIGQ